MQQQAIGPIAKWAAEKVIGAVAERAAKRLERRVKQVAIEKVAQFKRRAR